MTSLAREILQGVYRLSKRSGTLGTLTLVLVVI